MISKSLPLLVVVAVVGLVGLLASYSPVAAQQPILRSLSHSQVSPGDELTVTISDLALSPTGIGQILETVPDGFTYVTGSAIILSPSPPASGPGPELRLEGVNGRVHEFNLVAVDSFRYKLSVDANAPIGRQHFEGVFRPDDEQVAGQDEIEVVAVVTPDPSPSPSPEPTPDTGTGSDYSRSLPSSDLEPGDEFDVTITGIGLGEARGRNIGTVEETLPDGFSYVSGSAEVVTGGDGAEVDVTSTSGQVIIFSMLEVDSFTYKVSVGAGVGDGSHQFSGAFVDFLLTRTPIGGDTSVTVTAPEPPESGLRRAFPTGEIAAGDSVTVTITGIGLGEARGRNIGTVEETLPDGFEYVSGSATVVTGGNGAEVDVTSTSGQTVTFSMLEVDSLAYDVTVGADVSDGTYRFTGAFVDFLLVRTAIGGDSSLRVGPEPTPVPTATPEPTATPVPDDGTPTPATRTPRPTAVPPAPATPVAIEKVDATAVEGATVVEPDMSATVSSADGMATVMLPNTSRARTYQVMVVTDAANCEGAEGTLKACAMVKSFDAEGNLESDVELIRRATVVITLSSSMVEDLGGLPVVFQANALGAFSVQQMSAGGAWSDRGFSMGLTDDGGVAVTVTGLRSFGSIALTVDEDILQTAMYQVAGITPTAVPTPEPTATPEPEPTAVPAETAPVGDATAPIGLLIVLALTGALMVYTGSRVMRGRRSTAR